MVQQTPLPTTSVLGRCQCEHLAHFEHEVPTPKGNPGHLYGDLFLRRHLVRVETPFGVFNLCPECAQDCHVGAQKLGV